MSCGFGAVVLIFLMIDHASDDHIEKVNIDLTSEVRLLEEEVLEGREHLVLARNTIDQVDQRMVEAEGLSRLIMEEIQTTENEQSIFLNDTLSEREHINQLKADIQSLETEKKRLEAAEKDQDGDNVRQYIGEGDRQYLTGLKLGGARILILLDSSASMLDHSIVNIIRRRNMSETAQRSAEKWQNAIQMTDWLTAQFPKSSWYQIYHFNTQAHSLIPDTLDEWLEIENGEQVGEALGNLRDILPEEGTNLYRVFEQISGLAPQPDNIILITDGLPTQGERGARGSTVSGKARQELLARAVKLLPKGIPVNVILTPLEGDPMAASSYWKLALATGGAFMSPSQDWP